MIVVRLIGGLGNQLFQYAVGRHLAEIHKTVLKLDISEFEAYKLREYSLYPFNIQESFASFKEIRGLKFRKQRIVESLVNLALHKAPKPAPTYICEKRKLHFDPDILKLPDGVYLEGSWQNEKYFTGIEAIIRREFTVKAPPAGRNKELAEQIASCESVSLHIRRGDYVSNPNTSQVHGSCGSDYYLSCLERTPQLVKNPRFFIFSDEPQWARDNLRLTYPATVIDHNGPDNSHEDLRLMSRCRHHIIANSSFSWWGAWLGQNPEKIVLAPRRWVKSSEYDSIDFIPGSWNTL